MYKIENKINLAVIGASGVGKSTLINYLLPDLIIKPKTGSGKPVTEKGFHLYEGVIEGLIEDKKHSVSVDCYDSCGLEVDKYNVWMKDLEDVLNARDVDKSPSEWFHCIFYVIDAAGSRVQDNDVKLIKLLKDKNCRINVVFSKSDLVTEEESYQLHEVLKINFGDSISIVDVCSEGKKTRSGYHEPFGKHGMLQFMVKDFMMIMVDRMPLRFKVNMEAEINKLRNEVKDITDKEISWFNADENAAYLRRRFENELIPKLRDKIITGVGIFNIELVDFLEDFEVFLAVSGFLSSIDMRSFDTEYKTFYNGLFGDDPEICIDFSDYVWTAGKFLSKMIPVISLIDYANNFINRGERQRESVLKSWKSIEREAKKIVEQISEDMKFKLESAVKKIG